MLMGLGGFLCFGGLESDGVDEWVVEALWGFRGQKCFRPFTFFLLDQSSSACLPWPTSAPDDCPMHPVFVRICMHPKVRLCSLCLEGGVYKVSWCGKVDCV